MVTSIAMLGTQMLSTTMRSPKLIIKSDAQKQWLDLVLEANFMTLNSLLYTWGHHLLSACVIRFFLEELSFSVQGVEIT